METGILKQLLSHSKKQDADAYVYTNDGPSEPLCSIYTARSLSHILQLLKTNQLLKHSLKYILEQVNTVSIPLSPEQKKHFKNFNADADLSDL